MKIRKYPGKLGILVFLLSLPVSLRSQGTAADYERARNLRAQTQGLVYDSPERPVWIEKSHRFWYRKAVKGGNQFMVVDADMLVKQAAFDHEKLAASLSSASGQKYTGFTLPFNAITFTDNGEAIEFQIAAAGSGIHYYRINFDGTGLAAFTQGDGTHTLAIPALWQNAGGGRGGPGGAAGAPSSFSADMTLYVDIYSRVDLPPVMELHRTADQKQLMVVERADAHDLLKSGWVGPEAFVVKGETAKRISGE